MKYRHRLDIIADILNIAANGARKTRIMYVANLSYQMLQRYLDETTSTGFVQPNGDVYEITEKGRTFLERYLQFYNKYSKLQGELECMNNDRSTLERMCKPARKEHLGN